MTTMMIAARSSAWGWDEQADGWGVDDPELLVSETVARFENYWHRQGYTFHWWVRTGEVHRPFNQDPVELETLLASMRTIREEIWTEFVNGAFDADD